MKIDPVTLNIVGHALISVAEEMSLALIRSSYSTIVREAKDCSTAILDAEGNIVAQAETIPMHLNSISSAFRGCAQIHKINELRANEVLITNDPYKGGQHLPDIFLFTPIHHDKTLVGFSGSVAHHLDVGGSGPGSTNPSANDIFSEGFIIPALKIELNTDFNESLFGQIFAANVKVPQKSIGDLNAQLAANRTGRNRIQELIKKYGLDLVLSCMQELMNYSERRTREEIAKIPDGIYLGEEFVEGFSEEFFKIKVKVQIRGSDITVDFSGTDKQAKGIINAPLASTKAAVYTAMKCILTDKTVLCNEGCNRPIRIIVPYGSILNPRPPAPVRGRTNACLRVFDAIMRAFSRAVPKRVIATGINLTMAH